ncbi:chitobiase/beta-hexosaminidase C-terminal domain-containing protein [Cellulophaga sp. F20128]|uniref:chitobiase/beta-hexosaminidase C-terminal domain-containing protein n=1 Tax=Cellulophaga sp. F20128 TaxID=2926413 RepID=UPI001FF34359|nr:chitobiase/beta-hexosaminidase C-terminal domain-containing protein [Cellulophaga sp. F20128]MCK0156426.1 chitobiase/beta-hexosaminidase C-terminal domain-containing protein [Cellulophaga sp. F20128]
MQIYTLAIQIGNLHPLFVHLPIGILIFAFILELYLRNRTSKETTQITKLAIGVAAISALLSLGTGWLLGEDGSYDEVALFRHRWMAVGLTVCSVALYILKISPVVWCKKTYMPLFVITLILLGITGHLGGNMTHGEDFLFQDNTIKEIVITDVNKAKVYAEIIQPILDNKCVSCHNPNKAKGELLLTDPTTIVAGGENGSILDSIDSNPSSFYTRIHLPVTDEEHMPPKGKVQLTDEEIVLLKWWLENKNCFDCTAGFLDKNEQTAAILKSLETDTSPRGIITKTVDDVPSEWVTEMNRNGYSIYPIAENRKLLLVNLSNKKHIAKGDFNKLKKYANNIVELNLAYSNFTDEMASALSNFKNLTKLQLQRTAISDKTIEKLKKMSFLESLNLYGTHVSGNSLSYVKDLAHLKNLYLYQTPVTESELLAFKKERPNILTKHVADSLFNEALLNKPYFVDATDFFNDGQEIKIEHVFKTANLFYTTDGSEPDTTSRKYTSPFTIKESTTLKVFAQKKDWKQSETVTMKFKKAGIAYDSIWLDIKPNKSYAGKGAKTLIDLKRGSENFQDGHWLGFQGSSFTTTLELKQPTQISTVSIGSLSRQSSWVFHPVGYTIWTSETPNDFKQIATKKIEIPKKVTNDSQIFYDITFAPTTAKYIKIEVQSILKNPSWHPNPGGKSWVFVDEIIVN